MRINFNKITGKIKPMHAVNNIPLTGISETMHHYVGEAGMPFVRLHDTGGAYGMNRYVDIPNIFRNWDADENDPASYDFAFTDWLLNVIHKQNAKIFYRLGTSIETAQHIRAYNIYPPKDNQKWATICEKIIAHYNEGWADGYRLGIEYWEIWNEPDNFPDICDNCMWKGTFEEYMELYKVASRHLKAKFPYIKIGGYASCGFYSLIENGFVGAANSSERTDYFITCFHKFMKYVKENDLPLDFFSWHSYSEVEKNVVYEEYVHKQLEAYGYPNTESILNEWNPGTRRQGTLADSAYISDMMLTMQNTTCNMLMYYNGSVYGTYNGLYNPITKEPYKAYYAVKAFDQLYRLENQAEVTGVPEGVSCVAAADGEKKAIAITNMGEQTHISIETEDLDTFELYRLNETMSLEYDGKVDLPSELIVDKYETVLLKL